MMWEAVRSLRSLSASRNHIIDLEAVNLGSNILFLHYWGWVNFSFTAGGLG